MSWLKNLFSKDKVEKVNKDKVKKVSKKNQKRLDEWGRGQYLQVGKDIDNKAVILEAEQ